MSSLLLRMDEFVEEHCIPSESEYDSELNEYHKRSGTKWGFVPEVMDKLKSTAKSMGLWNLFMPIGHFGSRGISMTEYSSLSEIMGRSFLAPEACNCSAPDTGNMEVLAKFGSKPQQETWLVPLLEGKIRSSFLMTEPNVASSDATNIRCSIEKKNGEYIVNGRKWWSTGALHPNCELFVLMGRMKGEHWERVPLSKRFSIVLIPSRAKGIKIERALDVFGYDGAPGGHAEISLDDVRVPASSSIIAGEGRGFEIAQSRLGPGRVHHCMRAIGMAERALTSMIRRSKERKTYGKFLCEYDTIREKFAKSRIEIDQARLLVMDCSEKLEKRGLKGAISEVSIIKVAVPIMACKVIDRAIQVHGGMGVSQDTFLASAYAHMRTLRIADGPDEVHLRSVAKVELKIPMSLRAGRRSHIETKNDSKL